MGVLAARGSYVWCLAIVTKFKDLEEQIGEEEGGFKVILGITSHKGDEGWSNS